MILFGQAIIVEDWYVSWSYLNDCLLFMCHSIYNMHINKFNNMLNLCKIKAAMGQHVQHILTATETEKRAGYERQNLYFVAATILLMLFWKLRNMFLTFLVWLPFSPDNILLRGHPYPPPGNLYGLNLCNNKYEDFSRNITW